MEVFSLMQDEVISSITKAKSNFKKTPKERLTRSYIETRLENLKEQWSMFCNNHRTFISSTSNQEAYKNSSYFKTGMYDQTQELYMDYQSEMREKLAKLPPDFSPVVPSIEKSKDLSVKLPKISIPSFSGKYAEWTTFRDLFVSLIHSNVTLDEVQKLHYLKSHLSGEAEQLLRHIPITASNYQICWAQLEARYNNKKYLANCTLKRLMNQRNLVNESASGIKELLDTTNECLNSLQNLGIDISNWDIIVIYVISLKLDNETRKLWESKICTLTEELPTFTQLKEFLEQRFRALEFLDNKISKPQPNFNRNLTTKSLHVSTDSTVCCPFCTENHKLCNCKKFAKEDCETRRSFVRSNSLCYNCLGSNHPVYACRQSTRCRICKKRHHSLLHLKNIEKAVEPGGQKDHQVDKNIVAAIATTSDESSHVVACFSNMHSQVLLATALVKVESKTGTSLTLKSLLDQGSQASFITESAVQQLGLRKVTNKSRISGLGSDHNSSLNSNYLVILKLQSLHNPTFIVPVKAHVLGKITSLLPEKKVALQWWPELSQVCLADPTFREPNKIDLLLGAEVYAQILEDGLIKGPPGSPVAQNTKLGWILSGQISDKCVGDANICHTHTIVSMHTHVDENDVLKKFWELESEHSQVNKNKFLTEEEQKCEELFSKTTKRDEFGRYIVKLPFRTNDPDCKYGNSIKIATRRFILSEKRLLKNPVLKTQCCEVIQEYLDLGHMEVVPKEEINEETKPVYLPQVIVVREDKSTTKVRVCFDASCTGTNGVSLNNDLMVGPTLQSDLRHIIMRWRLHPISLVADIIKMYRQIKVSGEDVNFQRLLWRDNPESELQHLRLLRVTFGTASAPYLAVRTLHQISYDEGDNFPIAAEKVLKDFYIDDLMTGCQNIPEGVQIYAQMTELLKRGGFELQKWSSNSEGLIEEISEGKEVTEKLELKCDEVMKILGLTWNRTTDDFEYSVQLPPLSSPVTKRKAISDISRLFDPLGWLAPTIIMAKMFIQKIWISGVDWDTQLPSPLLEEWINFRNNLPKLIGFRIPRWMRCRDDDACMELHGFSDASNDAFSAVVYLRTIDANGEVHCTLVTSKTKVSPIKQVSIARLELCGAVLLAKLLQEVADVLGIPKTNIYAWTDSTVVLYWLSSHPSRWETFVANRVSEILMILDAQQWSHVRSKDNPADAASRGLLPSDLLESQMWRDGPIWLKEKTIQCGRPEIEDTRIGERKKKVRCMATCIDTDAMWTKFSSLRKMIRVLTLCKRFILLCQKKKDKFPAWLTTAELNETLNMNIKQCQRQHFCDELLSLSKTGLVDKKSNILSFNPFIDKNDIMRVGGRLQNAELSENMKHPILIPRKSHLTDLLISEAHEKTLHGGPQLMLSYLRSKYWVLDAKRLAKLFVRKCIRCVRLAARCSTQLMGQLPRARSTPCRPFHQSGVDFAGPISIRTSKGRGHHSSKGYICLFVCMATRAVHLEAVSDLTAQGFLNAFKRFVARRGYCADIWSDNGTNFVGAARELKALFADEKSTIATEIANSLATNGTTWHFIPPHAPNFGGLWEAGIKSTKHHLKRVIGNSTLTFEEISTVLAQIEACLNSRPVSQISNNPDDLCPLTPGHFLVGEPLILVPDVNYENSNISSLKRWQLTQRMVQDFWRRWSREYLTQFLQRHKWEYQTPEPKIGDIVLVKEDDLPPARWLYGVVTDKHPGTDNITRVVSLRCKGNVIKRPVSKLCILPVTD